MTTNVGYPDGSYGPDELFGIFSSTDPDREGTSDSSYDPDSPNSAPTPSKRYSETDPSPDYVPRTSDIDNPSYRWDDYPSGYDLF